MNAVNKKWSARLAFVLLMAAVPAAAFAQEAYTTPEQAVDALVAASRLGDKDALLKILGLGADTLISSGDPVADKESRERFLSAYDAAHKLESDGDDKQTLIIGEEEWPLPLPLVRSGDSWRFDSKAGEEEILNRRIGRNELNVIEVARAYVEAQHDYAQAHNHVYAQRFLSTQGQQDGLYWPVNAGEEESPLGPLIASAQAEGYLSGAKHAKEPYHGYYYKILKAQGPHAHGGARKYIVDGKMTKGFALLAYPARYGDSGIKTFIVNQHGIVHEKDLGPQTAKVAAKMTTYDPDQSWQIP